MSLIIFGVILGGSYSAYKQFSGYDPLKINPSSIMENLLNKEFVLNSFLNLLSFGTKSQEPKETDPSHNTKTSSEPKPNLPISFKFGLVADSHNDNSNLEKALNLAKNEKVEFIIGLGDYTEVGTIEELQKAKEKFDLTGIRYFTIPGDHDLWDARDKQKNALENYTKVFGPSYQAFTFDTVRFILIYNSDNYKGLGEEQKIWLGKQLEKINSDQETKLSFAFVHEPLHHPSSDRFMGKTTLSLQDEAKKLTVDLNNAGIDEVFSGDIHYFTRYNDSETNLPMTTIGALTTERNPQSPRFAVVTIFENGEYYVEDVEIAF